MDPGDGETGTLTATEHGVGVARLIATEDGVAVVTATKHGVGVAGLTATEHGVAAADKQNTKGWSRR